MWKNGQCVTVKGKRYRVKSSFPRIPCLLCAFIHEPAESMICNKLCRTASSKLDNDSHLEEI